MNPVRYFSFSETSGARGASDPNGSAPVCGITTALAGPMKALQDEENRQRVFRMLGISSDLVVSVRQSHSRIVRVATSAAAFIDFPEGDGILTRSRDLLPCVTVADCMPVYLFDPVSRCFGVLHSGWKGTGIIRSAIELASDEWNAKPSDFRVILGPHIRSCCYTVDADRADYFKKAFGPSCVTLDPVRAATGDKWPWRLSLAEANRTLCLSLGVLEPNILDTNECTSCNTEFGSCRREGSGGFTHMAAFISWH